MDQLAKVDNPESLHKQLVQSFTRFEINFRRRFPVVWLSTLLAPFVISAALLVISGLLFGPDYPQRLIAHAFMTFFLFGRLIILLGFESSHVEGAFKIALTPGELFGLVTYLDVFVAMFVTFHMAVLFRLPYVGPKIAMLVWDGKYIMEAHPWIKRMAFLGLVVFVIFPTSTTGSIGGSIFGRLLGLSRYLTVGAILLGSILGNGLMYLFAKQINHYVQPGNLWVKVVGVVILVGLVGLLEIRYRFVKKKYLDQAGESESIDHESK